MMISPEAFKEIHREKTYQELLIVRNELWDEVTAFEQPPDMPDFVLTDMVEPFPEVRYQCNLEYLAAVCELIADRYNMGHGRHDTEQV